MEKNNKLFVRIKSFINQKKVYFTDHAWTVMDDRKIKSKDVINAIINSEIIENYSDSKPCPSCLILGYKNRLAIHVVIALCKNHVRIITTYEPNKNEWVNNKIRRKKKSD